VRPSPGLAAVWRELERAVADKAHAWRLAALATVDGDAADARTVVLREVDARSQCLVFFTDVASPKLAQIAVRPVGTLLLWSAALSWQLRLRVHLGVQTEGDAVVQRWARVQRGPTAADYPNGLAVVTAQVQRIDSLELRPDGAHRHAAWDCAGAAE
jgi:pyridoxamine 5'-phosphate oxidase